MGSAANFIAPVVDIVAAVAAPELAPVLFAVSEGLLGAAEVGGLAALGGAGGSLLQSAVTGQSVNPLGVLGNAAGAGLGGFAGAGGLGDVASALGLGGSLTPETTGIEAAQLGATAPGASISPIAEAASSPAAAAPGATAAGQAAWPGSSLTPGTADIETAQIAATAPTAPPSTSGILSSLSGAYQSAKPVLSAASDASTLYGLANKILGPQAAQGAGPVAPLPGGNYTTAQAGAYGAGPLGSQQLGATTFNPQTGRYGGYYTPRGQQGSLGSASETLLG